MSAIRASFPFTVATGAVPSVTTTPDGPTRTAASTISIAVTDDVTILAIVAGIVSANPDDSTIVLSLSNPLDLTGGLGKYGAAAIDSIVYGGIPLDEAGNSVVVKSDGSARNYIDSGGPPTIGTASASDWAAGTYGVYVGRGDLLWKGRGSAASNISLTLVLTVQANASDEYQLDGRELLRAIDAASAFDPGTPVPDGIFDDSTPDNILVIGPTPAAGGTTIIESIVCGATGIEVFGPATQNPLPAELVYLGPSSGVLDIKLNGGATADWTSAVQNAPGISLGSASAAADLRIANIPWTTLPTAMQSQESVVCTITATTPTGAALSISIAGLAHPPVIDTGAAARSAVPLEGSPRVSIRVSDCDSPAPSAFTSGVILTVGGNAATEPAVSPDGSRLYFTVPAGTAGATDLSITNGDGSTTIVTGGLTYVADVSAGFGGLQAALAVAAEEAAEQAQDNPGSDAVATFCIAFRPYVFAFQLNVAAMLPRITADADIEAWQNLMATQAQTVIDIVNGAVATMNNPPVASFDGQPFASADDEPEYDLGAYVIMGTALDNVVVRSSVKLIQES